MARITPTTITGGYASIDALNDNFVALSAEFEKCVYRDGEATNSWTADQDANSKRLLNLPDATNDTEPVTYGQFTAAVINGIGDHGNLTGLADDDHTQYHNDARGNALYSVLAHTHAYQPLDTQLTDLAGLAYATNANKVVAVKATEDGFELVTPSGGSGPTDLDQILFGDGAAVISDPDFTYHPATGQFFVNTVTGTGTSGSVTSATPATVAIYGVKHTSAGGQGGNVDIWGGYGGLGGDVRIWGGPTGGGGTFGGDVKLFGGDGTTTAGQVIIIGGTGPSAHVTITGGPSITSAAGGQVTLKTGTSTSGQSGTGNFSTANVAATTPNSGNLNIFTGTTVDGNTGDILLTIGVPSGSGTRGAVRLGGDVFCDANLDVTGDLTVGAITASGNLSFAATAGYILGGAPAAEFDFQGITQVGVAAEALSFGELVYRVTADGRWAKAKADATSTSENQLGMCVQDAAGAAAATNILLYGKARADTLFDTFTVGAPVYISEATAGKTVSTAPSTTTNIVRKAGFAEDGNTVFFTPSTDYTVVP